MQHIKEISNNFFTITRKIKVPKNINIKFFDIKEHLGIGIDQNTFDQFFILAISQLSFHMQKAFSEIIEVKFHKYNSSIQEIKDLKKDNLKNILPKNGIINFNTEDIKSVMRIPIFYCFSAGSITISNEKCSLIYEKTSDIVQGIYFDKIKENEITIIEIDYDFLNDANLTVMLRQHLFFLIQQNGKITQQDILNLYPKSEKII